MRGALNGAASQNVRGRVDGLLAEARKQGELHAQVWLCYLDLHIGVVLLAVKGSCTPCALAGKDGGV
mgnify:CR=1 FL=1